jgi:hypothetical protein
MFNKSTQAAATCAAEQDAVCAAWLLHSPRQCCLKASLMRQAVHYSDLCEEFASTHLQWLIEAVQCLAPPRSLVHMSTTAALLSLAGNKLNTISFLGIQRLPPEAC